jgi:SAM-dependent methyltransferase
MNDHYTFGDSHLAADRLGLLARVFEASSERLLANIREPGLRCAIDLGCGPGHTTGLLQRTLEPRATWGLDVSERLIERARASAPKGGLHFAVHDTTVAPYPVGDADVIYARYLLNHIADPRSVLAACATATRRDGRLVLEENCALKSPDRLFADYYRRVEAMQRHYGQDMYIGARLAGLAVGSVFDVERYERTPLLLDARPMARLHAMNLRTWAQDPFAMRAFDARELAAMTEAFDAIADGVRSAAPVTCFMGQAVLRRSVDASFASSSDAGNAPETSGRRALRTAGSSEKNPYRLAPTW